MPKNYRNINDMSDYAAEEYDFQNVLSEFRTIMKEERREAEKIKHISSFSKGCVVGCVIGAVLGVVFICQRSSNTPSLKSKANAQWVEKAKMMQKTKQRD